MRNKDINGRESVCMHIKVTEEKKNKVSLIKKDLKILDHIGYEICNLSVYGWNSIFGSEFLNKILKVWKN